VLARFFPGAGHLQNPHPLVVHFPIAFLYGAALLYFLAWLTRRDSLAWTGLWFLALGLAGALAALATGWWSAGGVMLDPSVKANLLEPHRRLMLATSALAALLTLWAIIRRPMPSTATRFLFLFGLLVMLALLTRGAGYGGIMVYDYNGGGAACPQPIQFVPNGAPMP
jgi:uncharacterized membrane protein